MKYRSPTVQLVSCRTEGNLTTVVLLFAELPQPPLAPGGFGVADERLKIDPYIELHKVVAREGNKVTFETFEPQDCSLQTGQEYSFGSEWTADQLAIAQSEPEKWHKECFKSSDMVAFRQPGGSSLGRRMGEEEVPEDAFVVKGGWEHEHCSLCWKEISERDHDDHCGWVKDSQWVCQECFEKYIKSGFGKRLGDLI